MNSATRASEDSEARLSSSRLSFCNNDGDKNGDELAEVISVCDRVGSHASRITASNTALFAWLDCIGLPALKHRKN